jgi:predicted ArsR family transcriptional regulator
MRLLHASETPLSTDDIADGLNQTVRRISHHMQVLRHRGLVAVVAADSDGETFYVSRIKDQAAVTIFLEQADD